MLRHLIAVGLSVGAGLCSWSTSPALAADFYILNVTNENNVSLLDPTTIVSAQNGHKTFHFAQIDEFDLWIDNNMEVDCTGQRWRKLSAVSHLGGGSTTQGLSSPGPWDKLGKGTVGLGIHDVVCQWPNKKPEESSLYVATDFNSAVSRISSRIFELNHKKKK
jgi:hypothetical protein